MSDCRPRLISVNPLKLLLWTFRRSPGDVVDLYNTLSPVMQLATGGSMLNFGYWAGATSPLEAQAKLCDLAGEAAELESASRLIDVGSGLGAPAIHWMARYSSLESTCLNINRQQLAKSITAETEGRRPAKVNATSVMLPLSSHSVDRIIALESAQHVRPLASFVSECKRVLSPGGILVLAIPVTTRPLAGLGKLRKLGILSLTWSSEHYSSAQVSSALESRGFRIANVQRIGHEVYEPLTEYYLRNRDSIRRKILEQYPSFVEAILHRSLLKMADASKAGLIDYLVLKAI